MNKSFVPFLSFGVILLAFGFSLDPMLEYIPQNSVGLMIEDASYLSMEEKQMMQEVNTARTHPEKYLQYAQALLIETKQDSIRLSQMVSESIRRRVVYEDYGEVITVDTIRNNYYDSRTSAIQELIDLLSTIEPMNPLSPDESLFRAAQKHGTSQSVNNYVDHYGLDGTWPLDRIKAEATWATDGNENIASGIGSAREMVLQLLVDSGVAHRGHRKNILNRRWTRFTCYNVKELNNKDYKWWIQEFAY